MLTVNQFTTLFPGNKQPDAWTDAITTICPQYGIDRPLRLVMFLAQAGHESQGFTAFRENLNYSATALLQTWPKRFTVDTAQQFARKPEAIANHVYANRLGNGDEASGDGWRFRGYGPFQLTGRDWRQGFAKFCGKTLEEAEAYILTPEGGIASACYFWISKNLTPSADAGDVLKCTKMLNGGTNGLADRQARYKTATALLGVA